jgi:hypothetical protein
MSQDEHEKKFDRSTARPLLGCTSQETAFVQPDYPYGRRLRCQRRVWVETNPKYGMRLMTQTSNPKRPGLVWNKPDNRTYCDIVALWVDAKGYIATDNLVNLGFYELKQLQEWGERNQALLQADAQVQLKYTAALRGREQYEADKAAGNIQVVINKTEYSPDGGLTRSREVITLR